MFITNPTTQQDLYFTDNIDGLSRRDLYEGGMPFVISRVYPDDRELWPLPTKP